MALEERCDGLADTFEGEVVSEFVGLDADQTEQQNQIAAAFAADPAIDGFMGTGPVIAMSGLNAATDAGKELAGASTSRRRSSRPSVRDDRLHDRPAAVPAGLPADPAALLVRHEPERGRRRSPDPHRSGLRRPVERRPGRGARDGGHPLTTTANHTAVTQ